MRWRLALAVLLVLSFGLAWRAAFCQWAMSSHSGEPVARVWEIRSYVAGAGLAASLAGAAFR